MNSLIQSFILFIFSNCFIQVRVIVRSNLAREHPEWDISSLHIFGRCEETREPRESPYGHGKNITLTVTQAEDPVLEHN